MRRIGDILVRHKEAETVRDDVTYKQVTIGTNYKGVRLRCKKSGSDIGTKNQWLVKAGQFILSRIDARNGAFGIIPEELEGALVTNDFMAYEINEDEVDREFFNIFLQSPVFLEACIRASRGNTNRKRVQEDFFLDYEVNLPPLDAQKKLIKKINRARNAVTITEGELTHQQSLLGKLKQAILQEAIQGKLTADWRAVNPDVEPASKLLERIQVEKVRLIAEKKIRKETPLPEITPEEIPFEIPEGWEWCRLGDLTEFVTSGSRGWKVYYAEQGSLFIRAQNIKTDVLDLNQPVYVDLPEKLEGQRTLVRPDDILVTITGGNCGKTARIDQQLDEAYVSQHIALTRLMDASLAAWIHQCLTSDNGPRGVLLSYSKGDKPGLNLPNVRTVPIPLPPLAEQAAIVERVEALMATCRELEAEIASSRTHAADLLQAALKEAFAPAS